MCNPSHQCRRAKRKLQRILTALWLLFMSVPVHAAPTVAPANTQADAAQHAVAMRHVMLELAAKPVVHTYAAVQAASTRRADAIAAAQAQLATVEAQQQSLLAALAGTEAQVLYRVQRVYNGVALRVPADQVTALGALPGVRAVHPLIPKMPVNAVSVPFVGAPALWAGLGGMELTGAGTTIAVIDTGVDYLHAAFGGSRRYVDNDPTIVGDVSDFPGPKVIAGYDFAGDTYDANPDNSTYSPIPIPDPDPTDCYDHGTHVAATAAGYGVLTDGTGGFGGTYNGPYDASTRTRDFLIGPGVAPEAAIIALKIFGCQGSSDLTALAIEWAVDPNGDGDFSDKVDVINMSLGSTYGSIYDPASVASNNAALAGIIVVASAGNSRNVYYSTGSPAVADRALSVAATRDHLETDSQFLNSDLAPTTFTARGPRRDDAALKPDIAAPGQNIVSAIQGEPGWRRVELSGTSMAAPHVAGAMALLRQLYPTWSVEELKALVMNTAVTDLSATGEAVSPLRTGAGNLDLTRVFRTPILAMEAADRGRVSLSFPPANVLDRYEDTANLRVVNTIGDELTYALTYTPIVDLPGVDIRTQAPTVTVPAGSAIVTPIHLTADARAMAHARPADVNPTTGYPRHWLDEEAGLLELWPTAPVYTAELVPTLIPETMERQALVSMRYDATTGRLAVTVEPAQGRTEDLASFTQLELWRRGETGEPESLLATMSLRPIDAPRMGQTGSGLLDLASARLMAYDRTLVRLVQPGTQSMGLDGKVVATATTIHTPVFVTARRTADLRAVPSVLKAEYRPGTTTVGLSFSGTLAAGSDAQPNAAPALVTLLERQFSSLDAPPDPAQDAYVDVLNHADLRYVGISHDGQHDPNGPVQDRRLYFGLVTYAEWSTPNEVELSIYIDSNDDGVDDYRLFNTDALGYDSDQLTSDGFVAAVENLAAGTFGDFEPLNGLTVLEADTAPYRTNVMVLPVRAGAIGLDNMNTDFTYRVETVSTLRERPVDVTPTLRYDLDGTALDLVNRQGTGPAYVAAPDAPIEIRVDTPRLLRRPKTDVLVLHHHNSFSHRVEVIPLRLQWPASVYLPIIPGRAR